MQVNADFERSAEIELISTATLKTGFSHMFFADDIFSGKKFWNHGV